MNQSIIIDEQFSTPNGSKTFFGVMLDLLNKNINELSLRLAAAKNMELGSKGLLAALKTPEVLEELKSKYKTEWKSGKKFNLGVLKVHFTRPTAKDNWDYTRVKVSKEVDGKVISRSYGQMEKEVARLEALVSRKKRSLALVREQARDAGTAQQIIDFEALPYSLSLDSFADGTPFSAPAE